MQERICLQSLSFFHMPGSWRARQRARQFAPAVIVDSPLVDALSVSDDSAPGGPGGGCEFSTLSLALLSLGSTLRFQKRML